MICITTAKDLHKAEFLPKNVYADIAAAVGILDHCYGADRDMRRDLGGFVGIVGTCGDFEKLFSEWNIDIRADICVIIQINTYAHCHRHPTNLYKGIDISPAFGYNRNDYW